MNGESVPTVDLAELPGRPCSAAAALSLVGEKWALLAVREILLGNHRFDAIARNTGAPRDRLAARLRGLASVGVVERRPYSERPVRFEYHLTAAGQDLLAVIQTLRGWGERWALGQSPSSVTHSCGEELGGAYICRHCGEEVRPRDVRLDMHTAGWDRRGPTSEPEDSAIGE